MDQMATQASATNRPLDRLWNTPTNAWIVDVCFHQSHDTTIDSYCTFLILKQYGNTYTDFAQFSVRIFCNPSVGFV